MLSLVLSLRRRVILLRSKTKSFLKKVIPLTLIVSGILSVTIVSASTTTISDTVQVMGIVYMNTVNPAPPPQPNPIPNNGVPLAPALSGTDSAIFRGKAYPGASIVIIKNGLVLHEAQVFADGTFAVPIRNIIPGTYTFSLLAKDQNALKSSQVTYTIMIESGIVTEVTGISMPPTITTDKTEVKSGDTIIFSGTAIPKTEVTLSIFARTGIIKTALANASGTWSFSYPTINLETGDYNVKARVKVGVDYTLYSETVLFTVGSKNTMRKKGTLSLINARCDLNNDSRVNLLDFSIMAFWYKRLGFPMKVDLNSDGRINLTDLSILAYCWTG
jgi:hypothetical protein